MSSLVCLFGCGRRYAGGRRYAVREEAAGAYELLLVAFGGDFLIHGDPEVGSTDG